MNPLESQDVDRKSLRVVTGKTADWSEIAKDAVAFATARGGRLLIGIEDGQAMPPAGQVIPRSLSDHVRKRIRVGAGTGSGHEVIEQTRRIRLRRSMPVRYQKRQSISFQSLKTQVTFGCVR